MKRLLLGLGAAAAMLAVPAVAEAYPGWVTAPLNLRACASTGCQVITVIPGGAPVDVRGSAGAWNFVAYGGIAGYAAAAYINTGIVTHRPPVVQSYPVYAYPMYQYPVYPSYPGFYVQPGISFSFTFRG